jgi:hypothetical protein
VAPTEEKLVQHRLRWFVHIQRRPPEAPVNSGILKGRENTCRGRGRPKLTWEAVVKKDFRDKNAPRDSALDRTTWKSAVHVLES